MTDSVDKKALREQRRIEKQQAKDERKKAHVAQQRDNVARYGHETLSKAFGPAIVHIYANGYVKVQNGFGRLDSVPFERLLSIEASADVTKKSGLGRGAAAVVTLGVNLAGSNKRGDVYLTIATDRKTHVLHVSPPTTGNMEASKALEAAGRATLPRAHASQTGLSQPPTPVPLSGSSDVRQRLQQLQGLLDDGLITQTEFDQKRATLLESL